MKFIFVTGGVVSSLGKGLTAAALGTLLENRGLKVALQKFDPYLNVDPGTMSPYQHGEVYVLDDGAETDLDLGHYERFTNVKLTRLNNLTSGQVYQTVLNNEREGKYLGKTVQVIPHVTDEIKNRIHVLAEKSKADVIITEIGGTTGDIEGLPFLEAIREFALEVGYNNAIFMHVTYVPFIRAAGELKTKPTQQSVAKLREIGITPHVLVCRCERPLDKDLRHKISMFCNVPDEAVIEEKDVDHSIYEVPLMLQRERLDDLVCRLLHLTTPAPNMTHWQEIIRKLIAPQHRVRVGVVGKYIGLQDAYKSVYEAIIHGGVANDCGVEIVQVDAEDIEKHGAAKVLKGLSGVLVPGGFGERGIEGKIAAAQYARENQHPLSGPVPGHADRHDRIWPECFEIEQGAFHGIRSRHAQPGDRHAGRPEAGDEEGWHHAPGGAALPVDRGFQSGPALWLVHCQRTPSSPLRIQQRLPGTIRKSRFCLQRPFARWQAGGSD